MFNAFKKFLSSIFSKREEVAHVPEPVKEKVYGMLTVIKESESGRNLKFQDTVSGEKMTQEEAAALVREGKYTSYIVTKNNIIRSKKGVKNLG